MELEMENLRLKTELSLANGKLTHLKIKLKEEMEKSQELMETVRNLKKERRKQQNQEQGEKEEPEKDQRVPGEEEDQKTKQVDLNKNVDLSEQVDSSISIRTSCAYMVTPEAFQNKLCIQ